MKIGIDARFYGSIGKGLGRYTQKLIENLEKTDTENRYFVFLRKENFDEYEPKNPNFQKVLADFPWYSFAEQLHFPKLLRKYDLDLMHFPHFNVPLLYRKKFILTIHDLILIHFPTLKGTTLNLFWYWIKYFAYRIAIKSAARRAARIITVSEFTKKDIISEYPWTKDKVSVTYEACDNLCRISGNSPEKILQKYGIINPYLLYVGNAYPHKNLERLVDAFGLILKEKPEMSLVLVGKEDFFYKRLKEYVAKKKIKNINFLGFVSDQELDSLYRFAAAYVFPSLYEGFGLPPLEAMAKGAGVVSSNHECMREILGDAAWYADAGSSQNFAQEILKVLGDEKLRKELVHSGYERIRKYSWEKMAMETRDIYKKA